MNNNNIRDFIKSQNANAKKPQKPTKQASQQQQEQQPPDVEQKAENTAKKYMGMNEQQLMAEMQRLAAQNKQNGTLNADSLQQFYDKAAPMLTVQQRNRLKSLINSLK